MRRRMIVAALLLCLPMVGEGQDFIRYYPPSGVSLGSTAAPGSSDIVLATTKSITICNTADCATNYERAELKWDTNQFIIATEKSGTGSSRVMKFLINGSAAFQWTSGTTPRSLNFDGANAYFGPAADDILDLGLANGTTKWKTIAVGRAILGSKSKTLTDNTATAFVRLAVADDDYEGCSIGWTAVAEDANGDARQIRKGRTNVAVLNNSGTEACNFSASADDQAILVTAGTFTCSFDCNSAVADTVDLRATCDTSLDAAAEILTFEYRLDCESTVTVTPQ